MNSLDDILYRCKPNGECLEWTAGVTGSDPRWKYPQIRFSGKRWRGNRLVLFLVTGEIPEGLFALHKCDNPICLNPKHLYWGTAAENIKDIVERNRHGGTAKTHCPAGHPYSEENTLKYRGGRHCRKCNAKRHRERYHKEKWGVK